MNKIKVVSDIVKHILEIDPESRNSDNLLYYRVCEYMNKEVLTMPFGIALLSMKSLKLPNTETVRRTRQKIQATFPELAGTEKVEAMRAEQEKAFRDYAKEGVVQCHRYLLTVLAQKIVLTEALNIARPVKKALHIRIQNLKNTKRENQLLNICFMKANR